MRYLHKVHEVTTCSSVGVFRLRNTQQIFIELDAEVYFRSCRGDFIWSHSKLKSYF